jgi:O-antigen/teichoic acid export membrane protein
MAAAAHGASSELMALLFGAAFSASGGILSILVYAECALILAGVCTATLVAYGAQYLAFAAAGFMLAAAVAGHLLMVPRLGPIGAAATTATVAIAGASVVAVAARRRAGLRFPWATLVRAVAIAPGAWMLASIPAFTATWIIVKLVLVTIAVVAAYLLTGELNAPERRRLSDWLRRCTAPGA